MTDVVASLCLDFKNKLRSGSSFFLLLVDRVLRILFSAIAFFYIARVLGPDSFGQLSYAQAAVALFGVFSAAGLELLLVREFVIHKEDINQKIQSAIVIKAFGIMTSFLGLAAFVFFNDMDVDQIKLIGLLSVIYLSQFFDIYEYRLQAQNKFKEIVIPRATLGIIFSIVKIIVIYFYPSLYLLAGLIAAEPLIVGFIFYFCSGSLHPEFVIQGNKDHIKRMASEAFPYLISSLSVVVLMKMDQLILGHFKGASEVGIYAAAIRISEMAYMIPVLLMTSVTPRLLEAEKKSPGFFDLELSLIFGRIFYLGFALSVVTTLVAPTVVAVLYGQKFQNADRVLQIHCWSFIFVYCGVASSRWFVLKGRTRMLMVYTLLAGVINVLGAYFLTPFFGAEGAAASLVLSQAFLCFGFAPFSKSGRELLKLQLNGISSVFKKRKNELSY